MFHGLPGILLRTFGRRGRNRARRRIGLRLRTWLRFSRHYSCIAKTCTNIIYTVYLRLCRFHFHRLRWLRFRRFRLRGLRFRRLGLRRFRFGRLRLRRFRFGRLRLRRFRFRRRRFLLRKRYFLFLRLKHFNQLRLMYDRLLTLLSRSTANTDHQRGMDDRADQYRQYPVQ